MPHYGVVPFLPKKDLEVVPTSPYNIWCIGVECIWAEAKKKNKALIYGVDEKYYIVDEK